MDRPSRTTRPTPPDPAPVSSREKIIEVAEGLFARRGFAGVGMQEVADAAGLGKSSLFHHFRSKAQLYLSVLERVLGRLEERLAQPLAAATSVLERLDAWVAEVVDALAEDPPAARLLLRALVEDEDFDADAWPEGRAAEGHLAAILGAGTALLREGRDTGVLRRASIPHTLQTLIGATAYHFASGEFGEELLGRPLLSAEAVARRKTELRNLLHHGLVARRNGAAEE